MWKRREAGKSSMTCPRLDTRYNCENDVCTCRMIPKCAILTARIPTYEAIKLMITRKNGWKSEAFQKHIEDRKLITTYATFPSGYKIQRKQGRCRTIAKVISLEHIQRDTSSEYGTRCWKLKIQEQ